MKLNELRDNQGARKSATRVGRGVGSGKGKTCGRGVKGQKSRTGVSRRALTLKEGGQMSLVRRMPKKGFNNYTTKKYAVITLDSIQTAIDAGKIDAGKAIDIAALVASKVFSREDDGLRLISGKQEFKTKANFVVAKASAGAIAAVEKAGGKVEVLPEKVNKLLKEGKEPKRAKRKIAGEARVAKRRSNIKSDDK